MNLLYCVPALYNAAGTERVLTEKVNYLAKLSSYKIIIVTTEQMGKPVFFELNNNIDILHLDVDFDSHYDYSLPKKWRLHKRKLKIYRRKLIEIIKEKNIDICISLCGKEIEFLNKLPVDCKKVAEIHFSMNSRKLFMTSHYKGVIWRFLGNIRTWQLRRSVQSLDRFVVLTVQDKLQWEKANVKASHIPNLNPLKNEETAQLENKRIISVGRLDEQKGYDMLIDTWAIVSQKHPDWILDIFGIGKLEAVLQDRIIELNLVDKVNLKGLTKDVVANYLESSAYVMSSRYEGLPMVLIEAMSCGLPIVSFDCEFGPREVISDGIDGFLVKPNDVQALADKICLLIEDERLRKKMGIRALEKSSQYATNAIMPKWISLFEELMNERRL